LTLTSKERILATINLEEPDCVPFVPTFIGPWVRQYWNTEEQKRKDLINLGLDQLLNLGAPFSFYPDVKVKIIKRKDIENKRCILYKIYYTPAGTLRQVVYQTEDWPHGDDIPIFSDFVVAGGRSKEYLIKGPEDVEKFQYLLQKPTTKQVEEFYKRAKEIRDLSCKLGLLINGVGGYGGTYLLSICGLHNFSKWLVKNPKLIKDLLNVVHEYDLMRVRMLLDAGVDMITRDGWYETPLFWSVKRFKEMILPLLLEELELVHQGGAKFRYIMSIGLTHIAEYLKRMNVDVIYGVDPIVEKRSPQEIRRKIGSNICLWGGISEAVTVQQGTPKQIEKAVKDAIRAFAPGGGYVLSTIGSFFTREAWINKGPIIIRTWKKYGRYAII